MNPRQALIENIKTQLQTWLNTPELQDPYQPSTQEHVTQILAPLTHTSKAERQELFDHVYMHALPAGIPKDEWETVEWLVQSIIYRSDPRALKQDHPKGIYLIFEGSSDDTMK